jgi:signal peptidase II
MATTQLTRKTARTAGARTQAVAAVRSHSMRWAVAGITVAVLAADQVTKCLVAAGRISQTAQPGWLSVSLASNHGATGGVATGSPILITLIVLTVTALAAAFAVRATSRTAALCLAAVVGGALGNLGDRLFRSPGIGGGGVVDWIHLSFADGRGATLNVADLAILLGVIGATIAMVVAHKHTATDSKPATVALAAS